MSIGDFFKPLWKNSNPEVRLDYLRSISKSDKFKSDHDNAVKFIKKLAITDSDERIVNLTLSLLQEPDDFKEVLNGARSAAVRNNMVKEIEKNLSNKIPELETEKLRRFLSLINNENLIKDILINRNELWDEGIQKINSEEIASDLFCSICTTKEDLAIPNHLNQLIDKVVGYSYLKKMFQKYQASPSPLPEISHKLKEKLSGLPEYQIEIEESEHRDQVEKFLLDLETTLHSLREKIRNQDFSDFPENVTLECFRQQWENMKSLPGITDEHKRNHDVISALISDAWEEWQSQKLKYDQSHNIAAKLIKVVQKFDSLLSTDKSDNIENIKDQTEINKLIDQLKNNADDICREADALVTGIPEDLYSHPTLIQSRDEYIAQKNRLPIRLDQLKNHLLQRSKKFQDYQAQIQNQITEIRSIVNSFSKEESVEKLYSQLAIIKKNWEDTFNQVCLSYPDFFTIEKKEGENLLFEAGKKINDIEKKKKEEYEQLLSHLQQDLENHIEDMRGISDTLEKDRRAYSQINKEKFSDFLRSLEPYQNEFSVELLERYRNQMDLLEKKVLEIQENISREYSINLDKRKKLCSVLEEIENSDNKEKLVLLVKDAQKEWHKFGPVAKSDYPAINHQFESICERILMANPEVLRSIELQDQNEINRKKSLIEKLNAINLKAGEYQEIDWKKLSVTINQIVTEWKEIKILSDKNHQELNPQFKKLLDEFYQFRNHFFNQLKEERGNKIQEKENLLQKINKLREQDQSANDKTSQWRENREELIKLYSLWHQIGVAYPYPQNKELDHNFHQIYEEILSRYDEGVDTRRQKKEKLGEEIMALPFSESDPEKNRESIKKMFSIKKDWDRIAPIYGKGMNKLNDKFYSHYKKLSSEYHNVIDELQKEKKTNLEKKKDLLQQLENILSQQETEDTSKRVIEIQQEWKKIGPIPSRMYSEIEKPFFYKTSQFFKQKRDNYKKFQNEKKGNYDKKKTILSRLRLLVQSVQKINPDTESVIESPEQLKYIWEINRQMRSQGEQKNQKKIREEVQVLKNEWNKIGPTFSNKKLNDEFYGLLRNAKF